MITLHPAVSIHTWAIIHWHDRRTKKALIVWFDINKTYNIYILQPHYLHRIVPLSSHSHMNNVLAECRRHFDSRQEESRLLHG